MSPDQVEKLNVPDAMLLASGLFQDGHFAQAEPLFRAAEQAGGGFAAINGIGMCLSELSRSREALEWFDRGYAILRDEMAALAANRAKCLADVGRDKEALLLYDNLLRSSPGSDYLKYGRALVLLQQARYLECIAICNDLLSRDSENALVRFTRGFAALVLGDYASGFADYEYRRKDDIEPPDAQLWTGEDDLTEKSILVHADMGLGDNIMFSRYLPILVKMARKVVVVLPEGQRTLADSVPGVLFCSDDRSTWPKVDYWIRFMSLAWALKTSRENIPPPIALNFPSRKLEKFRQLIRSYQGLKVGLCWAGSQQSRYDSHRSIPLQQLETLFYLSGVTFFGLQKDVRDTDAEALSRFSIVDLSPHLNTFEDTACAMKCLDVMVTVDTSVAHMAGTVGVPTFVMLTKFRTYWLWLAGDNATPWYPLIRVFQQEQDGDWVPVIRDVKQALGASCQSLKSA